MKCLKKKKNLILIFFDLFDYIFPFVKNWKDHPLSIWVDWWGGGETLLRWTYGSYATAFTVLVSTSMAWCGIEELICVESLINVYYDN